MIILLVILMLLNARVAPAQSNVKDVTPRQLQDLSKGRSLDVVLRNGHYFSGVVVGSASSAVQMRITKSGTATFRPDSTQDILVQDFGSASIVVRNGYKGKLLTAIVATAGASALAVAIRNYQRSPNPIDCSSFPGGDVLAQRRCGIENQARRTKNESDSTRQLWLQWELWARPGLRRGEHCRSMKRKPVSN